MDGKGFRGPDFGDAWERATARFTEFAGDVAEIHDPLTWGLDLEEETVTGGDEDAGDERFLRSYLSFAGEMLDVETLRFAARDPEQAADIVRAALSAALAGPLHAQSGDDDDFLTSYQEYQRAMRAIIGEVDAAPATTWVLAINGVARPCLQVEVQGIAAAYATIDDRGVVVCGPADLLRRVDVVTRPIRQILDDPGGPRF